jgi:hypothetical protein
MLALSVELLTINLLRSKSEQTRAALLMVKSAYLAQAALAALNQDEQDHDKENARNNSNEGNVIHGISFPGSKPECRPTLAIRLPISAFDAEKLSSVGYVSFE